MAIFFRLLASPWASSRRSSCGRSIERFPGSPPAPPPPPRRFGKERFPALCRRVPSFRSAKCVREAPAVSSSFPSSQPATPFELSDEGPGKREAWERMEEPAGARALIVRARRAVAGPRCLLTRTMFCSSDTPPCLLTQPPLPHPASVYSSPGLASLPLPPPLSPESSTSNPSPSVGSAPACARLLSRGTIGFRPTGCRCSISTVMARTRSSSS